MPIRSRQGVAIDPKEYLQPEQLRYLFMNVTQIGTIMTRKLFFREELKRYEVIGLKTKIGEIEFSVRPCWTAYKEHPTTHLIIIGHVLFCHVNRQYGWYFQPSVRLFSDNPKQIVRQYSELIERAKFRVGTIPSACRQVSKMQF